MKLPVHRWFRYSAGFSAEWCDAVMAAEGHRPRAILDPFAGSGTTLLAAQSFGVESHGFEAHEFVSRVALAKLAWTADAEEFASAVTELSERARRSAVPTSRPKSPLIAKCFTPEALDGLLQLRDAFASQDFASPQIQKLVWLAITSVLRECSYVGTAQWQYVLPNRSKAKVRDPFLAFAAKTREMHADMLTFAGQPAPPAHLYTHDARRKCDAIGEGAIDLVITSPPYPNNYDYADATRLEMSFWGEVDTWSDLHGKIRHKLVASCSQHSAAEKFDLDELLSAPVLDPIRAEIVEVCRQLEIEKDQKAGKKTYHTMIAAYFRDLAETWLVLRHHVRRGGSCHFVIGDSAPYGVYVPVDKWLGELALAAGFDQWDFEKFRDRNIKWKNRKHRVPLKEGVLKVMG